MKDANLDTEKTGNGDPLSELAKEEVRARAKQLDDVDNLFTYHAPTGDQPARYSRIRAAAKTLASTILANTPKSADQTAAIRKLRECVMTANAAIALEPQTQDQQAPALPQTARPEPVDAPRPAGDRQVG
jgi:hypothetical protein